MSPKKHNANKNKEHKKTEATADPKKDTASAEQKKSGHKEPTKSETSVKKERSCKPAAQLENCQHITKCKPCPGFTIYDLCDCICNRPKGCMEPRPGCGVCTTCISKKYKPGVTPLPAKAKCCPENNDINTASFTGIVPDVICCTPKTLCSVTFPGGAKVREGNIIKPEKTKKQPKVVWNADVNSYYTICMTDPDAPNRVEPKWREFQHWLVVNIPGCNVKCGETLTSYIGAAPPAGSGLHRYVILVYKQPCKLLFKEQCVDHSAEGRTNFKISCFAKKYLMGPPIAGNFFRAEYDDSVGFLLKEIEIR